MVFLKKKNFPPQKNFFFTFFQCIFAVRTLWCFQKKILIFLTPKKWQNGPQKLLCIIGPDPLFPQSSPGHSPQPKTDSPYHEISGPDICSLICGKVKHYIAFPYHYLLIFIHIICILGWINKIFFLNELA